MNSDIIDFIIVLSSGRSYVDQNDWNEIGFNINQPWSSSYQSNYLNNSTLLLSSPIKNYQLPMRAVSITNKVSGGPFVPGSFNPTVR
jgi:hypothetical protein